MTTDWPAPHLPTDVPRTMRAWSAQLLEAQAVRQLDEAEQFKAETLALIESLHATAHELRGKLAARGQWPSASIVANAADLAGACLVAIGQAAEHLEV